MCTLVGLPTGADRERRLARRLVVALALGADVGRLGVQRGDERPGARSRRRGAFLSMKTSAWGVGVGVGVDSTVGRVPKTSKRAKQLISTPCDAGHGGGGAG